MVERPEIDRNTEQDDRYYRVLAMRARELKYILIAYPISTALLALGFIGVSPHGGTAFYGLGMIGLSVAFVCTISLPVIGTVALINLRRSPLGILVLFLMLCIPIASWGIGFLVFEHATDELRAAGFEWGNFGPFQTDVARHDPFTGEDG